MTRFWKFFDRLADVMAALAGALLVFISAAMCYTIFLRFLFRKTTIWITPMTEYALLWIVFLSTAWLLREKGHIITDLVYEHLSEKTKQCLEAATPYWIIDTLCIILVLAFPFLATIVPTLMR